MSLDYASFFHACSQLFRLMWRLHFEVSKQLQDLEVHRSAYVCRRCGTVFSSRTAYNCHWRVVHRNADENLEILSQVGSRGEGSIDIDMTVTVTSFSCSQNRFPTTTSVVSVWSGSAGRASPVT